MGDRVVVFAPSPWVTVTVEEVEGRPDVHIHAGGQGVWQARMVSALGVEVSLCCALGGETGQVLGRLLESPGIDVRAREVNARNGSYVHDRRKGEREPLVEMLPDKLTRHEVDDLYELTLLSALEAPVALLSGSADRSTGEVVPVSVYERLTTDLSRNGCRVVVDLAGDRLAAALAGKPSVVKVSHEELQEDGRAESDELADLLAAAGDIDAELVVVSRAADPTLALFEDRAVLVSGPSFETVDTRGGGDSMTAGIAAALARGEDVETALRLGAAAGAINVTRHGLGTGSGEAVQALAERVKVEAVS